MAGPQDQASVPDAFSETVVVGFELIDAEVPRLPERLATALESEGVRKAIEDALSDFARNRLTILPKAVTPQDAQKLLQSIVTATSSAVPQDVANQIKQSPEYKKLDASLKKLTDSFKSSPMGVWIDENKKWLYIVGAGAVLGGAAAMYVTRSGDAVAKMIPQANWSAIFTPVGSLKVEAGVSNISFVPSTRTIQVQTFATAKWQKVQARVNLTVTAADRTLTASASGQIIVPITKGVQATADASVDSGTKKWSVHAGVGVDVTHGLKVGVFVGAGTGFTVPPGQDAFKPIPPPPGDPSSRPGVFGGIGISGTF